VSPKRAYVWFAALCLSGVGIVLLLARPEAPVAGTAIALGVEACLCGVLALLVGSPRPSVALARLPLLVAVGLLTAWPGYFFGPNGWFAALLAVVLCLVGVLGEGEQGRVAAWLVYLSLAAGQATVFTLVATQTIPDASLAPVIVGTHPMSHHAAGHVFVQGIYLAAFVSARTFNRRYRAVAAQLEAASREEMVRAALLQEARADYRRALRIGRQALLDRAPQLPPPASSDTVVDPTTVASPDLVSDEAAVDRVFNASPASGTSGRSGTRGSSSTSRPRGGVSSGGASAWLAASNDRMRRVFVLILAVSVSGAVLLGVIAVNPVPLHFAWASIAAIACAVAVHNLNVMRRGDAGEHWPWTVAGVLSVGPAFSTGLHSAFSAVIVTPLFLGGLFRATDRAAWGNDRRARIWIGIALAQASAFALVFAGVVPDLGNVPVLVAGVPRWQSVVQHLLLQGVFAIAFAGGVIVDRRYEDLVEQARAAARRASIQETTLNLASEAIDKLLGAAAEAIFLDQQIGHYRMARLLGRGGMGDVYEAVDARSGERAAVKLLRRDRAADPTSLRFFADEARALGRVRSPYVARVLEAGSVEGDLPYIAMELVEGRTLSAVLHQRGRLALGALRDLVRDVSQGLGGVHQASVVHRDVKPQNIVLTGEVAGARWKLVDFGVAQVQDLVRAPEGVVVGTPQYMAPEQASGAPVDARADLYSLCLVIYRALTGRPAFVGDLAELARARHRPPPNPGSFIDVPRDVELALRIGLSVRPADRFASAEELREAFEAAFDGRLDPKLRRRGEEMLAFEPWTVPARAAVPDRDLPKTVSERRS